MTGTTDEQERRLIEATEWLLFLDDPNGEALDDASLIEWGVWSQDSRNVSAIREVQAFSRDLEIWRKVSALGKEPCRGRA
jgi:hypothetical protein